MDREADREALNDLEARTKVALLASKPSAWKAASSSLPSINRLSEARYLDSWDMEKSIDLINDDVTVAAFDRWLRNARYPSKFVYHVGHLAIDREGATFIPAYGLVRIMYEPQNTLGDMAMHAYQHGVVELVQRKRPDDNFEYIAFKRKPARR